MLKWLPVQQAIADSREAVLVGTEQPFIAGADQKVGLNPLEIKRQSANRLGTVHNKQRAHLAGSLSNLFQLKESAVCPVHTAQGYDGSLGIDGFEKSSVPDCSRCGRSSGSVNPAQGCSHALTLLQPGIDIARELFTGNHDVLFRCERQVVCRDTHPITDRGDEGDPLGRGVYESGKHKAQFFGRIKKICGRNLGGRGFASQTVDTGCLNSF